jgi:outer membrane protein W
MRHLLHGALAVALSSAALGAQTGDTLSQLNRSTITIGFGLTGTRETSTSGTQTSARATGQVGSLSFTHFVRPQVAIEISASTLDADAHTTTSSSYAEAITPVLFGLNFAPCALALTTNIRPYVSVAVGPYFHSRTQASSFTQTDASVQTNVGARFGAGANWYVSRHFLIQVEGDYHAVSKFEELNGVRKDPSGAGMSFGLGWAWGK